MRRALLILPLVAGACSAFGAATTEATDAGSGTDAAADRTADDAPVDGAAGDSLPPGDAAACAAKPSGREAFGWIFISNAKDLGNRGVASADALCAAEAAANHLCGTFVAWLSTIATPAPSRIVRTAGFIDPNGYVIFPTAAGLTSAPVAALTLQANKTSAQDFQYWTGTTADGAFSGASCVDWTSKTTTDNGTVGIGGALDYHWTNYAAASCAASEHYLCLEQ